VIACGGSSIAPVTAPQADKTDHHDNGDRPDNGPEIVEALRGSKAGVDGNLDMIPAVVAIGPSVEKEQG